MLGPVVTPPGEIETVSRARGCEGNEARLRRTGKPFATPTWSGGNSSALFAFAGRSGEGIDQLTSYWGTISAWGMN